MKKIKETSYERDLNPNLPIVVKGVMGANSKKFTKKFKNEKEYEKWLDKNEGNVEIYQIMNENKIMKKSELKRLINEVINESDDDILKQIKAALPELSKLISSEIGLKTNLQVKIEKGRRAEYYIIFDPTNYASSTGPIGKAIFKELYIKWSGERSSRENTIWFNPKLTYNHPSGGSNGTDFI